MKTPERSNIPICYFDGSVLMTSSDVWAYLILPPVSWAFLSESENEQQVASAAGAYANLRIPAAEQPKLSALWDAAKTAKLAPVSELHIRTASKRFSAQAWARQLAPPAARTPGCAAHMRRVLEVIAAREYWEKITYLGIRLGSRTRGPRSAGQILARPGEDEIGKWARLARSAVTTLGASELRTVPATAAQLAWLLRHAACGPSLDLAPLPALKAYGPDEVTALMEAAVTEQRHAIGITPDGKENTSCATVLTYSGFPKMMPYPSGGPPWAVMADWAATPAFPAEYSARISLMDPQQVDKDIRHKLISIDEEAGHTESAGARVPLALQERMSDAQLLQHALAVSGDPLAYATHRLVITAPDPGTCEQRARSVTEYCNRAGIKLVRQSSDQMPLYTETIPGGAPRGKLHIQQQPVTTIAGGMPQASETLGDRCGPYLGTAKTQAETPVFWSPFTAARRDDPTVAAILGEPGGGKALALSTRVPVPGGWATMGELKDGDQVYGADGQPCTVTRAWPVRHNRPCYEVEFSDHTVITADEDHLWEVHTRASRLSEWRANRRGPGLGDWRDQSAKRARAQVMTTADMLGSERIQACNRANYSVRTAGALQAPNADLPIPAYTLGAWLGDGVGIFGIVTSADKEIISEIEAEGETTWPIPSSIKPNFASYRVKGLITRLRTIGVLGNKHIPVQYLRASEAQRRALLSGLLDTDGHCKDSGGAEFCNTNERLARDVHHLVSTLGYKASLRSKTARLYGKDCGTCWTVSFTPADKVFRLPRKLARQAIETRATAAHRYITRIRPVASEPVRCISVDSPDNLYLVSEACIPTHNSFLTGRICLDAAITTGATVVIIDPIKKEMRQLAPLIRDAGTRVSVIAIDEHHPGLLDPFRFGGSLGEKIQRAAEVLMMLLPDTVGDAEKASRHGAVLRAVEAVAGRADPSLRAVIGELRDEGVRRQGDGTRIEENLVTELTVLSRMPLGSLCFASRESESLDIMGQTTILTFSGLDLPSATTAPGSYRMVERLSIALYYLATELVRGLFAADRSAPKLLAVDEAWALTRTTQGQSLIEAMSRMGRSHNIAMLLASHNVADLLDERITGCISTVFAVHSRADREVRAVFGQLGIADTPGNRGWLGGLSTGEVIMRDLDGRIGVVAIDDGGPRFRAGMDTNPTRTREVAAEPEMESVR